MRHTTLSLIATAGLYACAPAHDSVQIDVFDSALNLSRSQLRAEMQRERLPVRFDNGTQAVTCGQFLESGNTAEIEADGGNRLNAYAYVSCNALAVLLNAEVVPRLFQADPGESNRVGWAMCNQLDVSVFPSSLQPRLDSDMKTLHDVFGHLAKPDGASCVVDDGGVYFRVAPALRTISKGSVQWVLHITDESMDGNMKDAFSVSVAWPPFSGS